MGVGDTERAGGVGGSGLQEGAEQELLRLSGGRKECGSLACLSAWREKSLAFVNCVCTACPGSERPCMLMLPHATLRPGGPTPVS